MLAAGEKETELKQANEELAKKLEVASENLARKEAEVVELMSKSMALEGVQKRHDADY